MSSREFFVDTLKDELPRFERVLRAIPDAGLDFRPHERSRTTRELIGLIGDESQMIAPILLEGKLDMATAPAGTYTAAADVAAAVGTGFKSGLDAAAGLDDAAWNGTAQLVFGDKVAWETTRGKMAWGLLLDLIHHRGQLSVYLRPMGAKVPAIYGPSADAKD
jgi:uncharacterized damage-inducible protein DinB